MLIKLGNLGFRSGSNRSFLPTDISDLALWLDANDTYTITHTSGSVSQWSDKSGNNNHATQYTASEQFLTNSDFLNGKNVLTVGSGDNMALPSGLYSIANGDNTIFVAYKRKSNGIFATNRLVSGAGGGGNVVYDVVIGSTGTNFSYKSANIWASESTQTISNDFDAHIVAGRRTDSVVTGFFDGTAGANGTGGNIALENLYINRSAQGNWDNIEGVFAEIVIYRKSLSNKEMNQVGNYLADKWGISWSDI